MIYEYGFENGTWSYFEAGHGKGAADGIGAVIKRTADSLISYGEYICDARELYEKIKGKTVVKVFFIDDNDIKSIEKCLPPQIPALSGTFKVHQLISNSTGNFFYRNVSCYCQRNGLCKCFPLQEFTFNKNPNQKSKLKRQKNIPRKRIYSSSSASELSVDFDEEFYTETDKTQEHVFLEETSVNKMREGVHVLVEFVGGSKKKKRNTHMLQIQNQMDEEGEIKIMCLKANDDKRTVYKIDENDISYVKFEQIKKILPQPKLTMRGNRIFYHYPFPLNTYEK